MEVNWITRRISSSCLEDENKNQDNDFGPFSNPSNFYLLVGPEVNVAVAEGSHPAVPRRDGHHLRTPPARRNSPKTREYPAQHDATSPAKIGKSYYGKRREASFLHSQMLLHLANLEIVLREANSGRFPEVGIAWFPATRRIRDRFHPIAA